MSRLLRSLVPGLSIVTLVGAVTGCASSPSEDPVFSADQDLTQNILNITFRTPGFVNTLATPTAVLRPFRAAFLKVKIPASCGPVQVTGIALGGRTATGLPLALSAQLLSFVDNGGSGKLATYIVNGGAAATIFSIGLAASFPNFGSCVMAFEQSDTAGDESRARGYDFDGPATCPTPQTGIVCAAVISEIETKCTQQGHNLVGCPGSCTTLCDRPVFR